MSFVRRSSVICLCLIALASPAIAATETWRLTATVMAGSDSLGHATSFAQPGDTIQLDYVINMDTPLSTGASLYRDSILSVTFNGETSVDAGDVLAWNGLLAFITTIGQPRQNDPIDYILLSHSSSNADAKAGVRSALESISRGIAHGHSGTLGMYFGSRIVFATPTSLSPVPEPETISLLLTGLLTLGASNTIARLRRLAA